MAKPSYKVPSALNRSVLDHEITIFSSQSQPISIKQVLFYVGGLLITAWAATSTFIGSAHPGLIFLFVVWALLTTFYLGGMLKTHELRVMSVPPMLMYLPKAARRVMTRRSSNPSAFYSIAGIEQIDEEGGIRYSDGTVGQVYLIVGSASYLLFDQDRDAILDRVDAFWQKVKTNCKYIFITTKEPQRIYHQTAYLERRNQALEIRDPDLLELQNEQLDILTEHVGGRFTSIHQYVIVKADSPDALRQGHMILEAEAKESSYMIKEITMLGREDAESMLRVFYTGVDQRPGTGAEHAH